MFNDEADEYPIEHLIVLFAANFKLNGQRFNLNELLFLHEAIEEAISGKEQEVLRASGSVLH